MEVKIRIAEIDYGEVAVKVLPMLKKKTETDEGAMAKLLSAIVQLPSELIGDIFEAIPMEQKNEIVSGFAEENKARLLCAINKLAEKNEIGISMSHFSMSRNLEIAAEVEIIDDLRLVNKFLPVIKEKLLAMGSVPGMLRPVIERASADQICSLLNRFAGTNKGAFLASLINQNQNRLITLLEDAAGRQNIHLKIGSVSVQA